MCWAMQVKTQLSIFHKSIFRFNSSTIDHRWREQYSLSTNKCSTDSNRPFNLFDFIWRFPNEISHAHNTYTGTIHTHSGTYTKKAAQNVICEMCSVEFLWHTINKCDILFVEVMCFVWIEWFLVKCAFHWDFTLWSDGKYFEAKCCMHLGCCMLKKSTLLQW